MSNVNHDIYMQRCLQLARLGAGSTAPNPMVGAVLVHDQQVIGEGYHQQYSGAHAEVECLRSVTEEKVDRIMSSTLYVSLEPCAHYGKTPPCADAIIAAGIPEVVVGCRDLYAEVNGKGIQKLLDAGIHVVTGVLEQECMELNKRFFLFHGKKRPYVVLKWAQTADGKIGGTGGRLLISNDQVNRVVHKWRSEEAAIMVATRTAALDNPSLTTRLWPGNHPLRIVIDKELSLPPHSAVFDGTAPAIVFNEIKNSIEDLQLWGKRNAIGVPPELPAVAYYQVTADNDLLEQVLHALYRMNVQSLLVEGGSMLLQSFIDAGLWDEARVITNEALYIGEGLNAPKLKKVSLHQRQSFEMNSISYYQPHLHF